MGLETKILFIDSNLADWGDVDGDGLNEYVMASHLRIVIAKDKNVVKEDLLIPQKAIDKSSEYRKKLMSDVEAGDIPLFLRLCDINGDGIKEIFLFRADNIMFSANFKNEVIWSAEFNEAPKKIFVADLNGDGSEECILLMRLGDIYIIDLEKKKYKVKKLPIDYLISDMEVTDFDSNGKAEFIIVSKEGKIRVIDHLMRTKKVIRTHKRYDDPRLLIGDINNDGSNEVIIYTPSGIIDVYDISGKKLREFHIEEPLILVRTYDIDNDDQKEIIYGTTYGNLGIINFKKGTIEVFETNLKIDVDSDNKTEEIRVDGTELRIIKGGKELWNYQDNVWLTALAHGDVTGDGKKEIIIGNLRRYIKVFSIDGTKILEEKLPFVPICMALDDFNKDGKPELIIAGDDGLSILRLVRETRQEEKY